MIRKGYGNGLVPRHYESKSMYFKVKEIPATVLSALLVVSMTAASYGVPYAMDVVASITLLSTALLVLGYGIFSNGQLIEKFGVMPIDLEPINIPMYVCCAAIRCVAAYVCFQSGFAAIAWMFAPMQVANIISVGYRTLILNHFNGRR